ncbi:hypothetical protein RND81_13G074000 [Saponaria officinalis]|uniref:Secreted protein n=1 Tax=Saponaria officinalis TaxID=3572 RepID=A0AAW1GUU2_SAPOF
MPSFFFRFPLTLSCSAKKPSIRLLQETSACQVAEIRRRSVGAWRCARKRLFPPCVEQQQNNVNIFYFLERRLIKVQKFKKITLATCHRHPRNNSRPRASSSLLRYGIGTCCSLGN